IGSVPPDAVWLASDSPVGPTSNTETSFEPAFTANSRRPSSLSATAPCEPRLPPVPVPPVAIVPAALRVPSAARLKTDRVARDLVGECVDGAPSLHGAEDVLR